MQKAFYSNGKLLLSGEYAVLDGAKAWAMPTKFGQHLTFTENNSGLAAWKSLDNQGSIWFEGVYKKADLEEVSSSDSKISQTLVQIMTMARKMNPAFLSKNKGFEVATRLTFPTDWGLGSSSTLINNIAQWAQVDAYQLLWNAFSGSGYDIACAKNNLPISYQLENGIPIVEIINNKPSFSKSLYFVYLNKKRNSRDAINAYRKRSLNKSILTERISAITTRMIACSDIDTFEDLIVQHETVLSEALGVRTIKEDLFNDYKGSIKSLGAWGGDFVLATGDENTTIYFTNKGYHTVIPFHEMII